MRAYPVPHVQSELKWVCHGVTGIDQHQHQYQHLDGVEAHPPALGNQVIEAVSCTSGFQGICVDFQILLFIGLSGLVAGVVFTSTTLVDPAGGCGIGSSALEGFSGVVLGACPDD